MFGPTRNYLAEYDLTAAGDYELRVLLMQHDHRADFDANSEAVVAAVRAEMARRPT